MGQNSLRDSPFCVLHAMSAAERVKQQKNAVTLLLERHTPEAGQSGKVAASPTMEAVREILSAASMVFPLSPVQEEIYYNDSGTAFVPRALKSLLLNIGAGFVVRPGSLDDLQRFVQFAHENKLRYTLRSAGTWPFGGAVPLKNEIILDLSYLDFHHIDADEERLVVAPGAIFAKMRAALREQGLALRQDITNPNSGSICGWVATGGLGLGAFKYGHVRNSLRSLLLLTPHGEWRVLYPDDPLFSAVIGCEGQLGIIAGVELQVRRQTYVSKPYAFSFPDVEQAQKFLRLIGEWQLTPVSVLYFDDEYMKTTHAIESQKLQARWDKARDLQEEARLTQLRHEMDVLRECGGLEHVVVLEFDERKDYEQTLRIPMFSSAAGRHRFHDISYARLSVAVAHRLWEHRYMPVEMKQVGPSMLVSETILPLENFGEFMNFVRSAISSWTGNTVKTEAHLLATNEVLVQTILLADIQRVRHKLYLALVPFMTQAAMYYGGRPYGTGIWNLPFLRGMQRQESGARIRTLRELKKQLDQHALLNQGKFINGQGRGFWLRAFKGLAPLIMSAGMHLLHKGRSKKGQLSFWSLGRGLWRVSKAVLPVVVPPGLHARRHPILERTSACVECDSCERVCPTSDVFGMYGLATPVTRRKTAVRVARKERISRVEALGFLACTRCDNCTRVCPTDVPLTELFDLVERDGHFQEALGLDGREKEEFIGRFWQIMKENPLYRAHTLADQRKEGSHLQHGLKLLYPRGFAYGKLYIDADTCIRCGMCADENACTYGARVAQPRQIPELIDRNCALCNACINYCPQNKAVQRERTFVEDLIAHAVDVDEKRYWNNRHRFLRDTTTVQRATNLTEMADVYVTEEILMEIDKEASSGQIPVSGMGQGDKHRGIGFDAERFSHFHIVGPAQNRLHEGDPDEELSVVLGRRYRYCKFDDAGNMHNPPYPKIKLRTPILYNAMPLESNGRVELAMLKVAEQQNSLVVIKLARLLETYEFLIQEGGYEHLPRVIIPRVDHELIHHLIVNPNIGRDLMQDLWRMPVFEINYHPRMHETIAYIFDSSQDVDGNKPLLSGYLEISEYDMIGDGELLPNILEKIEGFLAAGVDILHLHGLRNKDNYFVTSHAVRAVHHYLLQTGRRHEASIIASGGIRLASDSQKTIQRGAAATLIDFAALLALDPHAYKAELDRQTTTERLLNLDIDRAVQRLTNQMESRKVQILEVLGAAGFKDLKKTVGEEGRLIDFNELEERIQKQIFENESLPELYTKLNEEMVAEDRLDTAASPKYSGLAKMVAPLDRPHHFYALSEENQAVYQRDHVWPGPVIEMLGRMAAGDAEMQYLKNVRGTGLLGDGFDMMKILYQRDPDIIPEHELDRLQTAVQLDKGLTLRAPWMFGGKSVGSIGLDSWRTHVIAARTLGIQFDTGEGGYPTYFFLNRKGEPIFFTERDMQKIAPYFRHDCRYTIREIKQALEQAGITQETDPRIFETLSPYPELQPFLFYVVVDKKDEPHVSTELKTGLFGVSKETIRKARRVVIAYSQGAKMGIGGHILAQKVNKLVAYLRGVEGIEKLNIEIVQRLAGRIARIEKDNSHPLQDVAREALPHLTRAQDDQGIFPELKQALWQLQQHAYELHAAERLDPIEFERLIVLTEEVISHAYTSIISPFPFHNCYSIEDVKAFVDVVRMINPSATISIKVSPSVDIEFIAAGLGRIARDITEEAVRSLRAQCGADSPPAPEQEQAHAREFGMKIEIWLDGPRGGTGASPNIIKGQMGMHIEYAVPLIHHRLAQDGLRNHVKFFVSGGIRTYEDVIKAIALGADGVIWGTAPMVAIGCDRNRNCHDGCSRGIATSNLIMQQLRDVDSNAQQMVNAFALMQMQVMRALAGLGLQDIRMLRGRFDKIQWLGLKERVDFRIRQRREYRERSATVAEMARATAQSNCGVAAIIGTEPIPSHVLDRTLHAMRNRGMDGVGVGKTLCFPDHPEHYAYRIMVKGMLQTEMEQRIARQNGRAARHEARNQVVAYRTQLASIICRIFLEPFFTFAGNGKHLPRPQREPYKKDAQGRERDYREFGSPDTDPGDIFRYFVRVKPEVLADFIEDVILRQERFAYIREYFPDVNVTNYRNHARFMQKAEDLFVFNHSVKLSQTLYVWEPRAADLKTFVAKRSEAWESDKVLTAAKALLPENLEKFAEPYLELAKAFSDEHPPAGCSEKYQPLPRKIAAVMSAGKNFAVWKTAGREIPWDTPPAPNNIIHVRLATGSVVEQMNAHPFAKLHTALTHNGETTNYETLKQRVAHFGLPPLATTDTEVASLKFHLLADELEYPDWALFEAFSPTTGDDLALMPETLQRNLEEVQRVEFTSSPDGPYQYLCLRHKPEKGVTERVDLKDPADLRPSTTALWLDRDNAAAPARFFSMIASEEQAIQAMLDLLDAEGLIEGAAADRTFVSDGMINRFRYNERGTVAGFELVDRYGSPVMLPESKKHYSYRRSRVTEPGNAKELRQQMQQALPEVTAWIRKCLPEWEFNTYRWVLEQLCNTADADSSQIVISTLTYLIDHLRGMPTGEKAKSSLLDITRQILYSFFDRLPEMNPSYRMVGRAQAAALQPPAPGGQALLISADGFAPEGTDPRVSLAAFLGQAYALGWRKFILYRVNGQRLISTATMGAGDTDDVEIDVYGIPGEYLGAFMQGGRIRVHGNAQNFAGMCMHHGELRIYGNAGKVCGYASKGGDIFILGDIVDRAWTNSVNDARGPGLRVHVLGSASKYAGESLMGGDFFFGGLYFDEEGAVRIQDRPYRGTKLLGGAGRGRMLFFNPYDRLDPHQYTHGKIEAIPDEDWRGWQQMVERTLALAGIAINEKGGERIFEADGKRFALARENFTLIVAKGGLKGYESH